MHDLIRKPMTVALAAVLLFCSVVPVPTGAYYIDRLRFGQANANPAIAIPAAEAAVIVLGTLFVAQGLYPSGLSVEAFNANMEQLYDDFSDYYTAQNDISQSELEAVLAGSYMNGNVDLTALATAGITGAIPGFASYLLNNGMASTGATSLTTVASVVYDGATYYLTDTYNNAIANSNYASDFAGMYLIAYEEDAEFTENTTTHQMTKKYSYYCAYTNGVDFTPGTDNYGYKYIQTRANTVRFTITATAEGTVVTQQKSNNQRITYYSYNDRMRLFAAGNAANTIGSNPAVISSNAAVVADGVTAGTFAATQGMVQAFEPTAEQLQAGYDASILQGVEQAVADLGTISTGIAALDVTLNGLLGVAQGISSTLSNTLIGQYCAAVTQWLGATPFGTVMGTVIDGLDDIPDAVADGAAVVAGGVAALPGALEGVIEGVLEGVFGQPLAIPGFLQDILAGVQAIPGALEGAIEGINFPGPEWPELPRPESGGEPFQIALPPAMQADFEADLRERVPFCYVIHMKDAIDNLSGNLSYSSGAGLRAQSNYNMRSFYFDVEIPFAGPVHFDAEPFLSQPFGSLDIATTIRILATALLCFGLLYRSYKVVERSF